MRVILLCQKFRVLVPCVAIVIAFILLHRRCSLEYEPRCLFHRLAQGFVLQGVVRRAGSISPRLQSSLPSGISFTILFFIIIKLQVTVTVLECPISN